MEQMPVYRWTLSATDQEDPKAEFSGLTITAPSEKMAWQIVFGLSGKYGRPGENQYDLEQGPSVYAFSGSEKEWLEAVRRGEVE